MSEQRCKGITDHQLLERLVVRCMCSVRLLRKHSLLIIDLKNKYCLALVATALPAATGLLELAALGAHVWGSMVNAWGTEVTHRLAGHTWSTDKHAARAGWELGSELIEGHNLAASSEDTGACGLGEAKSADLKALWHVEHADVIGDGSDHNCDAAFLASHELGDLGVGDWWAVHLAHEQTLEDNLVEVALDTASHEAIELSQKNEFRSNVFKRRAASP